MSMVDRYNEEVRILRYDLEQLENQVGSSEIMNWYMITFKDGSTEIFRARAADYNNGTMISFFGVVFSDYEAEYYHVNPAEIRSSKELVTGEVIDEAKEAISHP